MKSAVLRAVAVLALCSGATALYARPYVCMETNAGKFCMELLPESAPNTVANFLRYVSDGRYNTSMIHRSEPGFVIQGGGYTVGETSIGVVATDAPIANEFKLSNLRGTVAMARQAGNANSATSQWFVNLADNIGLNTVEGGYTVFARIVTGMDVVDTIAAMPTFNLISILGSPFGTTPAMASATTNPGSLLLIQLVSVTKAYRTEANPALPAYQCSVTSPADTLTEMCNGSLTLPVLINGVLYEGTLDYIPGRNPLAFTVDKAKLRVLTDTGQARATFSNGVLTIPSVRNGSLAFNNVRLNVTSSNPLELTLDSYTPR